MRCVFDKSKIISREKCRSLPVTLNHGQAKFPVSSSLMIGFLPKKMQRHTFHQIWSGGQITLSDVCYSINAADCFLSLGLALRSQHLGGLPIKATHGQIGRKGFLITHVNAMF